MPVYSLIMPWCKPAGLYLRDKLDYACLCRIIPRNKPAGLYHGIIKHVFETSWFIPLIIPRNNQPIFRSGNHFFSQSIGTYAWLNTS